MLMVTCERAEVRPSLKSSVAAILHEVDHADVLRWVSENVEMSDLIDSIGHDRLLNTIGMEQAMEHFGFEVT